MNLGKQNLEASIIEISNTSKNTKEITMLIHKIDFANGNGLDFKEEYTKLYMDSLVDKPVVCSYYPLKDDLGDHEPVFDDKGKIIELRTIAIGTITEVWIGDYEVNAETKTQALYAKAVLWSYKYPQIVNCVENLFRSNNASSSVEVEIYQWGDNPTKSYRYPTNYAYLGNCLLGSDVAPADSDAGVISVFQREIAIAARVDMESINEVEEQNTEEGGKDVSKEGQVVLFNKGNSIKFRGSVEVSELSFDDISNHIYNLLNPVNSQTDEREYNYWIKELFQTYVIVEEWYNSNSLYQIGYSVSDNTVTLAAKTDWVKVEETYQPVGTNLNKLLEEKTSAVGELESKVTELNDLIVSQKEVSNKVDDEVQKLKNEIAELLPYKEKFELAQKESKKLVLSEKYSKLLSEETFKSERVQNALDTINEIELNSIVVEEIAKEKDNAEIEVNNKEANVVVTSSSEKDLLPENVSEKYGLSV